jgi:hypothetical protein
VPSAKQAAQDVHSQMAVFWLCFDLEHICVLEQPIHPLGYEPDDPVRQSSSIAFELCGQREVNYLHGKSKIQLWKKVDGGQAQGLQP